MPSCQKLVSLSGDCNMNKQLINASIVVESMSSRDRTCEVPVGV